MSVFCAPVARRLHSLLAMAGRHWRGAVWRRGAATVEGTDEEEGRWPGSLGIYSKTVGRAPILLIVGVLVLADGPAGDDEWAAAQSVLLRLVRKQKPSCNYASMVARDAGRQDIYLAFEDDGDAKEFCRCHER